MSGDRGTDRVALAQVFVDMASALAGPYAVTDVAQRLVDGCVELLDVWAAGLLLADPGSSPKLLAASTHEAALLELVQVRSGQGPCLAAMDRDDVVAVDDLDKVEAQWPEWVPAARSLGINQAYGLPLRREGRTVGALNLFRTAGGPLLAEDLTVARAMGDVAAVGILQHRALDHAAGVTAQLQRALDSRVVIEQAKGLLAERAGIGVGEAFNRLRQHARSTSQSLGEVARALVEDGIEPGPSNAPNTAVGGVRPGTGPERPMRRARGATAEDAEEQVG
jgi:transcriptional regulator with GAF, ATPase, and Fis domain